MVFAVLASEWTQRNRQSRRSELFQRQQQQQQWIADSRRTSRWTPALGGRTGANRGKLRGSFPYPDVETERLPWRNQHVGSSSKAQRKTVGNAIGRQNNLFIFSGEDRDRHQKELADLFGFVCCNTLGTIGSSPPSSQRLRTHRCLCTTQSLWELLSRWGSELLDPFLFYFLVF